MNTQETPLQKLPTTFTRHGWAYQQLDRIGPVALFERVKRGHKHYEVVRIQLAGARVFPDGSSVGLREVYPSTEQWGTCGWTFSKASHADPRVSAIIAFQHVAAAEVNKAKREAHERVAKLNAWL